MIRKSLLIWITIITSIIFIFRLGYLQLSNDFYKSASNNNAIQELPVYPERGLMFDRNGNLLVSNQPMYDLELIPENLSEFDTLELSEILGISKNNLFVNTVPDIIGLGKLALTPNEYFSNNSLEKQIVILAIVWQP